MGVAYAADIEAVQADVRGILKTNSDLFAF